MGSTGEEIVRLPSFFHHFSRRSPSIFEPSQILDTESSLPFTEHEEPLQRTLTERLEETGEIDPNLGANLHQNAFGSPVISRSSTLDRDDVFAVPSLNPTATGTQYQYSESDDDEYPQLEKADSDAMNIQYYDDRD